MGKILEARRSKTKARFERLRKELTEAEKLAGQKACVYVTGSFGRGEASAYSDLDLFILGRGENNQRELSKLDEIRIKADLIEASQRLQFPDFSGDGQYLVHYTEGELIQSLGKPEDDANNTFTARLLLLLESQPLLCGGVYAAAIEKVIAAYWKDYPDHKKEFVPAFLANDISRLWRTFCVNYEAQTRTEPEEKKAKRRLKNYKLKHSRLLTCYSALLYLLAVFAAQKTVHPKNVIEMAQLSPTARLEWLLSRPDLAPAAKETVRQLLDHYERFLAATNFPEQTLLEIFLDPKRSKEHLHSANELGNLTFEALELIGRRTAFHRALVV